MIESNASEAHCRFGFRARIRDDHDRPIACEHRPSPGRILPDQPDVDAPFEMRCSKLGRVARVEHLDALFLLSEKLVDRERSELARQSLIERWTLAAVEHGVVREVRRRVRLVCGDEFEERLPCHRLQRVVRSPLFADSRDRFLADRFAA